jgi:ectoine hydroxylase-related dioxygenase (phytanoyl-CoA dioxygenase family)
MNIPSYHPIRRFGVDQIEDAFKYYGEFGYCVFDNAFPVQLGEDFWSDVEHQISTNERLTYSWYGQLHEGRSVPLEGRRLPRIVDIESHSKYARELLLAPTISRFLQHLYGEQPTCLQTLTYKFSSEQGAHSDKTLVTPPCAYDYDRETLAASWIALETSDESNGALIIYPGSHKRPKRGFYDGFDNDYGRYTEWLYQWLAEHGYEATAFQAKPGEILFWHGDFVHAGGPILATTEEPPTRKSLVCHYARIDPRTPSRDPRWTRIKIRGGSYFQKTSSLS